MNRSRASERSGRAIPAPAGRILVGACLALAGCRADLNQQLLERELRMQEDQIYRLQDELASHNARLESALGENTSLRRQLGIVDAAPRPARSSSAPTFVPPPRLPSTPAATPAAPPAAAPGGLRFSPAPGSPAPLPPPAGAAPLQPPALDGVPPLPSAAARPPVRRLSFEESVAGGERVTHLVVNPAKTVCYDGDGDGVAEGLALVVEPRDADERLVTVAGDVVVTVHDPALPAGGGPAVGAEPGAGPDPALAPDPGEGALIARYEIAEAEVAARFRRTSRARGIHLVLPWSGPPPRGATVQVHVAMTTFDGGVLHVAAPVPVRAGGPDPAP